MFNRVLNAGSSRRSRQGIGILLFFAMACLEPGGEPLAGEQQFPDVIAATVSPSGTDAFDFDATISSSYDTPQRYADGFRIIGSDDKVYGERKLLHDHASEQPFTRELTGVSIPPEIRTVTVQARDQKYGWGGKVVRLSLPRR